MDLLNLQILSVIEIIDGQLSNVESFIVSKENEKEVVDKAEKFFIDKIKEHEILIANLNDDFGGINLNNNDSNYDYYIDSGYYIKSSLELYLSWSKNINF
jgi:hypothetical protein